MPKKIKKRAITPSEALASLREIPFDPAQSAEDRELARAEMLQSVLTIARMDHVSESQLVRDVVRNALGKVPEIAE